MIAGEVVVWRNHEWGYPGGENGVMVAASQKKG